MTNPHKQLSAPRPDDDADDDEWKGDKNLVWRCDYCDMVGTMEEIKSVDCSHKYLPCDDCGNSPACDPKCASIERNISASDGRLAILRNDLTLH